MSISSRQTLSVITRNPQRTVELGRRLGRLLKRGDVVALVGELGAGKTTLVKGVALGCGVRDASEVTSPTFILMSEHKGRLPFYHFDAYRLHGADELTVLGSHEYFEGTGVCAVVKAWCALPVPEPRISSSRDVTWRARTVFVSTRRTRGGSGKTPPVQRTRSQ